MIHPYSFAARPAMSNPHPGTYPCLAPPFPSTRHQQSPSPSPAVHSISPRCCASSAQTRYVPCPMPPPKSTPQFDELFFPPLPTIQYLPTKPTSSPSSLCRNASRSSREGFKNTPSKHQSRCLTRRARRTLARRLYVRPSPHHLHLATTTARPRDQDEEDNY